jgi:hypothetical protein
LINNSILQKLIAVFAMVIAATAQARTGVQQTSPAYA